MDSDFTLTILGTASALPTLHRYPSAQALNVRGRLFLIDCGEGAQMQMRRLNISPLKVETICLTHTHGDHVFGIFGLLSTMGMLKREKPLKIFAPRDFGEILDFYVAHFSDGNMFPVEFEAVEDVVGHDGAPMTVGASDCGDGPRGGLSVVRSETVGASDCGDGPRGEVVAGADVASMTVGTEAGRWPKLIQKTPEVEIYAFPLHHSVKTFGYLFRETEPQLNVRKDAIEKYGLSVEEIVALKTGRDVVRGEYGAGPDCDGAGAGSSRGRACCSVLGESRDDAELAGAGSGFECGGAGDGSSRRSVGQVIAAADVTYRPWVPRSFAYCSDTMDFPELVGWVRGVDLLYHEATYPQAMSEMAAAHFHSTTVQAAQCAADAGVGKLIVGHYSSRFQDVAPFLDELRAIFPNSYLTNEGDIFDIPIKK